MKILAILFSIILQGSAGKDIGFVDDVNLRWLSCVVFSSRQLGLSLQDEEIDTMIKSASQYDRMHGDIPEFFFRSLDRVEHLRLIASFDEKLEVKNISPNSIILIKNALSKCVVPVVVTKSRHGAVEFVQVLPRSIA